MTEGRCLCGALRYRSTGRSSTCCIATARCAASTTARRSRPGPRRPASGFAGWGQLGARELRLVRQGHREFCRICGSVAPMVLDDMGMVIVPAGNLEAIPASGYRAHVRGLQGELVHDHRRPAAARGVPRRSACRRRRARRRAEARRRAGQLPVRRRRVRDLDDAAAHVLLPLLALPPGAQRRALRQCVLQGRGIPVDARRGPGAGLPAARRPVLRHRVLPPLRLGAAARFRRAQRSRQCRRARSTAIRASRPPVTSSWTPRRRGSTSRTTCRSSRKCRRAADTHGRSDLLLRLVLLGAPPAPVLELGGGTHAGVTIRQQQ